MLELHFSLLNQLNFILQWTQVSWHEVALLITILFHFEVEVVGLVRKLCRPKCGQLALINGWCCIVE